MVGRPQFEPPQHIPLDRQTVMARRVLVEQTRGLFGHDPVDDALRTPKEERVCVEQHQVTRAANRVRRQEPFRQHALATEPGAGTPPGDQSLQARLRHHLNVHSADMMSDEHAVFLVKSTVVEDPHRARQRHEAQERLEGEQPVWDVSMAEQHVYVEQAIFNTRRWTLEPVCGPLGKLHVGIGRGSFRLAKAAASRSMRPH